MKVRNILILSFVLLLLCSCGKRETIAEQDWRIWYAQGTRCHTDGALHEAVLAFTSAVEAAPKEPAVYVGRGTVYFDLAEGYSDHRSEEYYKLAQADFEKAVSLGWTEPDCRLRLAKCLEYSKDWKQAAECYRILLSQAPAAIYYDGILLCYEQLQDLQALEELARQAYEDTGDRDYLSRIPDAASPDIPARFGSYLLSCQNTGFAFADLDKDGTPELIAGTLSDREVPGQVILQNYTVHVWDAASEQIISIYHGQVDSWFHPEVFLTADGGLCTVSHGSGAYFCHRFVFWDGSQITEHMLESYDVSNGADPMVFAYTHDGMQVSPEQFSALMDQYGAGQEPLTFHIADRSTLIEFCILEPQAAVGEVVEVVCQVDESSGRTARGTVCGLDAGGSTVWCYETEEVPLTELTAIDPIGSFGSTYYLSVGGTVVALEMATGEVLWTNDSFGGRSVCACFGPDGTLYLSGYYGPALCVIHPDGTTKKRIEQTDDGFCWPMDLFWEDGKAVILFAAREGRGELDRPAAVRYDPETGWCSMSLNDLRDPPILTADEVEAEVLRIRDLYNAIEAACGSYRQIPVTDGITAWSDNGVIRKIAVERGIDGLDYRRFYYFDGDEMVFTYAEAEDSYRLYFLNGYLIRMRYAANALDPGSAVNTDLIRTDAYIHWENLSLTEGTALLSRLK